MTDILANPLGSTSQFLARQRIEGLLDKQKLFAAIDADPGIVGAGVVFIDAKYNVVVLREFRPICSIRPKRLILREINRYVTPAQFTEQLQNNPRESKVLKEAGNAALACAGAFISWWVVFSGTIAVPFTAGTSAVLTYISIGAAVSSGLQCVNGAVRTVAEVAAPEFNDRLDGNEYYTATSTVLDYIALMGVGVSGLTTVKYLQVHKAATGRSWYELAKSLSRQQRKALTDELLSIQNPALKPKLLKLEQAAGNLPKRYTPTQISHATKTLVHDSVGAVLGLAGSGTVQQSIAIGLFEEQE
ncbi:NAD synthetase [Pantoea sp. Ap-967]|uniref:NAD synthetase n=1 Tax=Pantoea sp. Ap-967 TaxID=2608362 RepID=UPI00141EFA36|nr:NAD synthetase [Pantoea sp. Ap-967]NIE75284.1 NAD synthetase [Pantoea sp. Ap-967]